MKFQQVMAKYAQLENAIARCTQKHDGGNDYGCIKRNQQDTDNPRPQASGPTGNRLDEKDRSHRQQGLQNTWKEFLLSFAKRAIQMAPHLIAPVANEPMYRQRRIRKRLFRISHEAIEPCHFQIWDHEWN